MPDTSSPSSLTPGQRVWVLVYAFQRWIWLEGRVLHETIEHALEPEVFYFAQVTEIMTATAKAYRRGRIRTEAEMATMSLMA